MKRATARPGSSARLIALPFAIALGAVALTYWSVDILSPALPDLKADLELSAASAGIVYSLLFFGRLVGNFPAVYLLVRWGTAATACLGGLILMTGTAIGGLAGSGIELAPARVIQGVGIAFLVNACLRAFLGARPERGAAMTYFSFAATVGGVFGLQSGGLLTEEFGWRSVFVFGAAVAGVITLVTFVSWWNGKLGRGAIDVVPKAPPPIADEDADSPRLPLILNFLVFFNYSPFVALPLYAEKEFGASPETTARLLMVITIVHLVATFPVGQMIRRLGAHWCLAGGMVVAAAGTALILPMPSPFWIAAPLVLYGVGQVSATNAGGDIVLHLGHQSARSISHVRFSSDLGLVIGPYVTGALADAFGYGAPFVALPLMMSVAAVFAIVQAKRTGAKRP